MKKLTALVAFVVAASCRDGGMGPAPGVASILVTSSLDTILDLDRTAQLTALARDAGGTALPAVQFAWTTSAPAVVTVSAQGVAFPQGPGSATVTAAEVGGSGSATLRLRVVQADLEGVAAFAADAYGGALVAALTGPQQAAVQPVWAACATNAGTGNIVAVSACTAALRAAGAAAADPTDRALLTILGLYAEHIDLRLGL
jgi:hypothetical protein